jgi:hypothetical protein
MITKEKILGKTHYGLHIYAFILRQFYPNTTVLSLIGRECSVTYNPYNDDKKTLVVSIINNCAFYKDTEVFDFLGDVFDFAQLFFKAKSPKELLYIIDKSLHLNLENKVAGETIYINEEDSIWSVKCSFFKAPIMNVIPSNKLEINDIYRLITSNIYEATTSHLRGLKDIKAKRKYKAKYFDYVTFSGTFTKRNDVDLIHHSLLMTIDLDHLENLNETKQMLLNDQYFDTELLFKSPSGDGLKWIIKINLQQVTHEEYFIAVTNYLEHQYSIKVDLSGKDISRACFLSYDPEAYINPRHTIK